MTIAAYAIGEATLPAELDKGMTQWVTRFMSAQDKNARDLRAVESARPACIKSYTFPTSGKNNRFSRALVSACRGALLNRGTHCKPFSNDVALRAKRCRHTILVFVIFFVEYSVGHWIVRWLDLRSSPLVLR